ncbi:MAG: AsmA-like C-terminal region-containing protein, partial [Thermoplasmata archaeon]
LQLLHDILIIFPYADFSKAEITGSLLINKSDEWKSSIQVNYAKIRNIYNKKSNRIIDADVSTEIEIDVKLKKIAFNKIYGYWDNKVKTTGNGYLTFTSNPEINFNANADYIDLEPLIDIIELWIDADLEKSIYFRDLPDTGYSKRYSLSLDIKSKEVIYHKKKLNELSIHIYYKYPRININNLNFFIYGGKVESNGEIYVDHDPAKVYFGGKLENYDVEILLKNFTDNQYLRGTMYGDFKLLSNGNNQDAIINNMIIDGNLVLSKGELIGYLNILRPVASIGKIINLSNPTNDSLSFEYIRINYQYKNNNVFLKNLIMKGVGLDAIGEGRISTAGDMDVKITLALSGVAGKAIKLPIIYKGIFGKSLPYVDPIWLGSVYVGTIFLAGPAGATVGGIAGSAVSGVINKLYSNIKSIIGSKDKE